MKILSWNVQGAKKIQVIQEVKFLIRTQKADMLFLLETMVNESNIKKILPLMGFHHYDYVSPVNHSGGITVLWNNDNIHASVVMKESRAIHMLIHDPIKVQNSIISGVYAPAQSREKNEFWHHLIELNKVLDLLLCLIGDFNEILCPNEKFGGQPPGTNRFHKLRDFLCTVNVECVPTSSRLFT